MLVMFLSMTVMVSGASNFVSPTQSPTNGAIGVGIHPALPVSAIVNTTNGSKMTVFCWSNDTGVYHASNILTNVGNTSVNWNLDAMTYSHKYYWGINMSNATNHDYHNYTFTFTTEDEPAPSVYDDMTPVTRNLLQSVLPILLAVVIMGIIVAMAFTMGLTKESLMTIMIITIIGIIVIQVITGL